MERIGPDGLVAECPVAEDEAARPRLVEWFFRVPAGEGCAGATRRRCGGGVVAAARYDRGRPHQAERCQPDARVDGTAAVRVQWRRVHGGILARDRANVVL